MERRPAGGQRTRWPHCGARWFEGGVPLPGQERGGGCGGGVRGACTFAWVATAAAAAAGAAHHALGPEGGGGGGAGGGGWPRHPAHRFPACRHATTGGYRRRGNTTRKSGPRVGAVAESTTRERVFQGTAAGPRRGHHGRLTHPRGARRRHAGRGKISKENRLCGAPQARGGARGWCVYKSLAADGDLEIERGARAEPSLAGEEGPPPGVGPWDDASCWRGSLCPVEEVDGQEASSVDGHCPPRTGGAVQRAFGRGGGMRGTRPRRQIIYRDTCTPSGERGKLSCCGACGRQGYRRKTGVFDNG